LGSLLHLLQPLILLAQANFFLIGANVVPVSEATVPVTYVECVEAQVFDKYYPIDIELIAFNPNLALSEK